MKTLFMRMASKVEANTKSKWLAEFNKRDQYPFKFLADGHIVFCVACESL